MSTARLPMPLTHIGHAILRKRSGDASADAYSRTGYPVEPLALRLERKLIVYDGPLGLAKAFSAMWDHDGVTVETAERQVWRILGRKRPYVTPDTADRWAMFLGTHVDWIWREGV